MTKIKDLNKDIESIFKKQIEILEVKNTRTELKFSLQGLNGKYDTDQYYGEAECSKLRAVTTSHSLLISVLGYTTNLSKFKGLKSCNMFYNYNRIK